MMTDLLLGVVKWKREKPNGTRHLMEWDKNVLQKFYWCIFSCGQREPSSV